MTVSRNIAMLCVATAGWGCSTTVTENPAVPVVATEQPTAVVAAPVVPPTAPVAATPLPDPLAGLRPPPTEFVDLRAAVPTACFSIGYHLPTNFTGAPLPGYAAPGAWAVPEVARSLVAVAADLTDDPQPARLIVYDAYRPVRASRAMVAWATRAGRLELFAQGYIARRSGHNHGHTVDLGLANSNCEPLDLGTPWDALVPESRTRAAAGEVLERRLRLQAAMRAQGFVPYFREWWHFTLPVAKSRPRDVPYGCAEPEEGAFVAPSGWERAGWAPETPPTGACSPR